MECGNGLGQQLCSTTDEAAGENKGTCKGDDGVDGEEEKVGRHEYSRWFGVVVCIVYTTTLLGRTFNETTQKIEWS